MAFTPNGKETTMKVFQIGAAGGVGRRLAALLVAQGDEVTGMHRRAEQAEVICTAGPLRCAGSCPT